MKTRLAVSALGLTTFLASGAFAQGAPPAPGAQPTEAPAAVPSAQPTTPEPAPGPPPVEPTPQAPATPPASATPPATEPGQAQPSAAAEAGKMGLGIPMLRYGNTWDLNLEGGVGSLLPKGLTWMARARAGALFVRDSHFYQVGATVEYLTTVERPAFGLQAEYLHLEVGGWAQIGGSIDTKGRPGGMAALGISLIGVELDVREFERNSDVNVAILGKLRIPIGIIAYAISSRKK